MTALARILAERIAVAGPLTVAEFMGECLLDPARGYYPTRDPLGAGGDFTTAPEISQMFGELLGLALAQAWMDRGRPTPAVLAELGPGRGTLMADALRAGRRVPGFADLRPHLVEVSPALRDRQAETLRGHAPTWHDDPSSLPDAPLFLIANEFLDALPIRQFVREGGGWRERIVGIADSGGLCFGLTGPLPRPELDHRLADTRDGDLVEVGAVGAAVVAEIAARIARRGGVAIIVDYGGWRSLGDTLQAVRCHARTDPLAMPGDADLTAHVDFEAMARAASASGASVSPMVDQGVLLERLGITARARRLAEGLTGAALESHVAAHRRLTHPDEMGSLFKAIAIHDGAPPPGFDA